MGFSKDLWTSPVEQPDGNIRRERNARWGRGKRWLAVWHDDGGKEVSQAFTIKDAADKHWQAMETDRERGEYIAPKAGREKFGELARKHLRLRDVGAASRRRYDSVYRNHVEAVFGDRPVKAIKPSEVLEWLRGPLAKRSASMQEAAYLIVCGTLDLAVADGLRRDNPARSPIIPKPRAEASPREAWPATRVWQVTDEHPEPYQAIPPCAAGLGLRQGCAFALAEEDFDFGAGTVLIRRQVAMIAGRAVFKAPKGGKTRTVPLSQGVAALVQAHVRTYPPRPYSLPWMAEDGELAHRPHECRLLFRWHGDDPRTHGKHIVSSSYDQGVWKPALSRAALIPAAVKDGRGIHRYAGGTNGNGMHALRHFYSTALLDAGVSLAGVMEFMGHSRKGKPVTLGVYGHVTEETFEQARQAVDRTLFRLRPVEPGRTVTELRAAR